MRQYNIHHGHIAKDAQTAIFTGLTPSSFTHDDIPTRDGVMFHAAAAGGTKGPSSSLLFPMRQSLDMMSCVMCGA